ncbi:hypothetical protein EON65_15665 [archaeon]|nr:MAG: hypothetical protein EON65_15665 [archaeon]
MLFVFLQLKLNIRSLHLIGQHDDFNIRSSELASWYEDNTVIFFNENHNVPSVRTEIYPVVQDWLNRT